MPSFRLVKLYKHECKFDRSCAPRWAEFKSLRDEERDLDKRMEEVAIVHRHTRDDGWTTSDFTINNGLMQDFLNKGLEKLSRT